MRKIGWVEAKYYLSENVVYGTTKSHNKPPKYPVVLEALEYYIHNTTKVVLLRVIST
jgi:hypothetical protein